MINSLNHLLPLNIGKTFVLMGIICLMFIKTSSAEAPYSGVSFEVFYDELLPYGDWINDPIHGYVWVPYAEPDFQPYATNGYWAMSTYGNTWVSNYDWGWAPFHYGRWYFDDYLGWAWVPGYEWGPAWVNWRSGGGYYGWAPLMPGLNIHVAINIPSQYYVFVPGRRLISRNIYNYYIPRRNVYRVYNQTTIINNTYVYNNRTYVSGPERREIENVTRRSVPVYQVSNSNRPGKSSIARNSIQVYQPEIRQGNNSRNTQARPSRVVTATEHQVNRNNSRSSASQVNVRTTPSNSRMNNSRTMDNIRQDNRTSRRVDPANVSRPNQNQRVQSPANNPRSTPSYSESNSSIQQRQQNRVNANPNRNVQEPKAQPSPRVRQRTESNNQVKSGIQAPTRKNSVQPARSNNQVRSQGASRSSNTTQMSSSKARERSSGNTTRTSSPSRRSTRGNN